jgi:hypothetical protein
MVCHMRVSCVSCVKRRAVGEERGGREEFRRGGHDSGQGEREERERRQKEREEREKEWVKKAQGGDATRNRRVFGVLLGTLQRFRKDQTAVAEKVRVLASTTRHVWCVVAHNNGHTTETGARA